MRAIAFLLRWSVALVAWPVLAAAVGRPAPPFTLPGASGKPIALEAVRGKVVYVDFWASWCGPCRRSFPWMNRLQARYAGEGLAIVAIDVDQRQDDALECPRSADLNQLAGARRDCGG